MPSSLIKFSPDEVAIRLSAAVYGVAPSNALLNSYKAEVVRIGESAFARNLADAFKNMTDAQLSTAVLGNLGVNTTSIGTAAYAALEPALTTLFTVYGAGNRGQIVLNLTRLLADLEMDAVYGGAAKAWNSSTDSAFSYSSSTTAATSTPVSILGVRLTASADNLSGTNFVSIPVYTPGGNTFINSLQDEDILTGTSAANSLTVTLGSVNDAAEGYIEPKLNNIQTVNVEVTGGGSVAGIGFRDANSLATLNVTRVTANTNLAGGAAIKFGDMPAGATSIGVSSSSTNGKMSFEYREDVLTGINEALTLALASVRAAELNVQETGDGGSDTGYFFEKITVNTTGTNDIDSMTISANGQEDVDLKNKADTTKQSATITVGSGSLEINKLTASGLDSLTIAAGGAVNIAPNLSAAISAGDGLVTGDLESLTITGASNVRIDGVRGGATGLKVDGSAMTGNLRAGVVGTTSANAKFSLTSGSGDDEVRTFGALGGPLTTAAGKDTVTVSGAVSSTGSVSTGAGNDTVTIGTAAAPLGLEAKGDTLAGRRNDNATDGAASIDTGDDDDTVVVGALSSAVSYNEGKADDANADDTYVLVGATVNTGAGNDTVTATTLAEATSISTGAGNDTLRIEQTGNAILAGDTDANRTLGTTGVAGLGVDNREVSAADATKVDALGAVIDLGAGDDTASFGDALSVFAADGTTVSAVALSTTIVGIDAELRGGEGNDTLAVTALDNTVVTSDTSYVSATATNNDVNANVTGFEAATFTILNQITNAGDVKIDDGTAAADPAAYAATGAAANTANESYSGSPAINDLDTTASITADMLRFDSALKSVALDSQEQPLLKTNQQYEAGTATAFTLKNLGAGVTISLKAQEATGVSAGKLKDDTANDVTVDVSASAVAGRGLADELVFNLAAGSGAFDFTLNLNKTTVDPVGASASTADDENILFEKLTVGLAADDKGHAIVLNGHGDARFTNALYTTNVGTFSQYRNQAGNNDKSIADYNLLTTAAKQGFGQGNTAATEFTLGSATAGTVEGTTTSITGLSADKITLNGAGVVNMSVAASNNYTIVSGTGADTLNMVSDTVDDEDAIDGGATGRNTLVINGGNSIGFATTSQPENDDAWTNKKNLQVLEVRANAAGANANTVVLDEQTLVTGLDTINLTATTKDVSNQTTTIVYGDDFRRDTTITTSSGLVSTQINITNRVSAADTNQAVTLFAQGGAGLSINDLYGRSKASLTVTVAKDGVANTISSSATATTDGNVDLDIATGTTGTISSITLLDNNPTDADGAANADNGAISVTVDNAWSRTSFTLDASGIDNYAASGASAATIAANAAAGGLTFDGSAETDATLTVRGTANNDTITGGAVADVLEGNAGADSILGGLGTDSLSGGSGNDILKGEAGNDTLDGGTGNDALTGGTGADSLTGGTGVDSFIYAAVAESTGGSADTISDFATGSDKISITHTLGAGVTVNLGRFSVGGDSTSLDKSSFDGYYSGGQLAIDVNGDGLISDNLDYVIKSSASIAASDINYTITTGNGNNFVRTGQGVDSIETGTGDDTFVIVGSITAAQAAAYAAGGDKVVTDAGAGRNVSAILPFSDLTTARSATEVNTGDKITAGAGGTDVLAVYGTADLTAYTNATTGASTIVGIETLVIHSDVTLTPEQVASVGKIAFNGDAAHVLKIVQPAIGTTTPAKVLSPSEVTSFLKGEAVTGVVVGATNKLGAAIPVEITNAGANTVLTLGSSTTTETAKSQTVAEVAASSGLSLSAIKAASLTGLTAAQLTTLAGSLSKYDTDALTGVLTFSSDVTKANLETLLNSTTTKDSAITVQGSSGADSIDLSGVTTGLAINGGAGNDTITSTQGTDTIDLGTGNDTLVLTAATTGGVTLGATVDVSGVDRVSNFGSGDTLQLPFVPSAVSSSTASGTAIAVIRGNVSGTTFTPSATGTATLFVYDEDGAGGGTTLGAVLLVGYAPTVTGATGGTGSTGTFGG